MQRLASIMTVFLLLLMFLGCSASKVMEPVPEPEPSIDLFKHTALYSLEGSVSEATVDVANWEGNVSEVRLFAADILGENSINLVQSEGDSWAAKFSLANDLEPGDYDAVVMASLTDQSDTALYKDVVIIVVPAEAPVPLSIEPSEGRAGSTVSGITLTGEKFCGTPYIEIWADSGAPLNNLKGKNIRLVDEHTIIFDVYLPLFTQLAGRPITVWNTTGLAGGGVGFNVLGPIPEITSTEPSSAVRGTLLTGVVIKGDLFRIPNDIRLRKAGEPDIAATNIDNIDRNQQKCDFEIPSDATPGLYDLAVRNGTGNWGYLYEYFEILP